MDRRLVFRHHQQSAIKRGGTQGDRQSVPIGHGASLARRRLAGGKSPARLSGGVEGSSDFGQSDSVESALARKAS